MVAAVGEAKRKLGTSMPAIEWEMNAHRQHLAFPGVIAIELSEFIDYKSEEQRINAITSKLARSIELLTDFPLILICDDSEFISKSFANLLWTVFTRSNPSHDIYGVKSFNRHKHWGCEGPLIIDCRMKPHNAPYLELDPAVEKSVDALAVKGKSLHGII